MRINQFQYSSQLLQQYDKQFIMSFEQNCQNQEHHCFLNIQKLYKNTHQNLNNQLQMLNEDDIDTHNQNDISFDTKQNSNTFQLNSKELNFFNQKQNSQQHNKNTKKKQTQPTSTYTSALTSTSTSLLSKNNQIQIYQERIRQLQSRLIEKNKQINKNKEKCRKQFLFNNVQDQIQIQKMNQTILDSQCKIIHLQTQLTIAQKQLKKVQQLLLKRTNNYQVQLSRQEEKIRQLTAQKQELKAQILQLKQTETIQRQENQQNFQRNPKIQSSLLQLQQNLKAKLQDEYLKKIFQMQNKHKLQIQLFQMKLQEISSAMNQQLLKKKQKQKDQQQQNQNQTQLNFHQIQKEFCRKLIKQLTNCDFKLQQQIIQKKLSIQYISFTIVTEINKINKEHQNKSKHLQQVKKQQISKLSHEFNSLKDKHGVFQQELKFYKEKYQQNSTFNQLFKNTQSKSPYNTNFNNSTQNAKKCQNQTTQKNSPFYNESNQNHHDYVSEFQHNQKKEIQKQVKNRRKRILSYQCIQRRRNCSQAWMMQNKMEVIINPNQNLINAQKNNKLKILQQNNSQKNGLKVNTHIKSNFTTSPAYKKYKQVQTQQNYLNPFQTHQKNYQQPLRTNLSHQHIKQARQYKNSDFIVQKNTSQLSNQRSAKDLTKIRLQEYSKRQSIHQLIKNQKFIDKNRDKSINNNQQNGYLSQNQKSQKMQRCKSLPSSQMTRNTISIKDLIAQKCSKKLLRN